MRKIFTILILLSTLTLVLFTCECTNNKNHFENSEISFDYPTNWKTGEILDLPGVIIGVSRSSDVNVKITKAKSPSGYTLERFYDEELNNRTKNLAKYCLQSILEKNITVDGVPAYESIYKIGCNNTQTQQQLLIVIFERNGYIYTIFCTVIPPENFDAERPNLDMIINSFHVK